VGSPLLRNSKMKLLYLIFVTSIFYTNGFPSKRSEKTQCRKVPQQKLEQQCNLEELVVKTANLVQQCKDEFVTRCKQTYSPVPLVPFRTSRIVGSTSLHISGDGSGSHYSKREDVHHGLSTGRTCKQEKQKKCYNVPEEKVVKTQVCKDISSTIYIEECDQIDVDPPVVAAVNPEAEQIEVPVVEQVEIPVVNVVQDDTVEAETVEKLTAVEVKITPAVVQVGIPKGISNDKNIKQQRVAAAKPNVKKQKRRQKKKTKAPVIHNFTTARTVGRESRKINQEAAYAAIQSQVAEAKATVTAVRKAVANKEIDFTEAKETIEGVVDLLTELSEKSKKLEENLEIKK